MGRGLAPAAESSAEYGHQTPINGTVQMDIPPAHETGEYYILVANLPFGCTWRCLKDFTRTVCEPAFVTVFQDSTCGWVKVSGRENFDKAWALLNGGELRGKALIADPGNETKAIKIKVLVDPSAFPAKLRSQGHRMSHTQRQSGGNTDENVGLASCGSGSPPPSTTASYDRGSSEYLASATLTLLGNSATAYTRALAYPVVATAAPVIPASPYHGHGGQYYGAPMSPYDQQSTTYSYAHYHTADVPSPVPCYFNGADQSQVPFYNNQPPSEHSKEEGSHSAYAGHVETEARRVFIRGISKKATGDEVEKLISRGIAGIDLKAVETIDVPLDQNNRSRGHAIVTFRNVAAAQQAVAQLGKMTFHGRALEARPAVDYPTVSASKSSSSGNHGRGSSGGTRGTGSGGGGSSGKAGGGDNRSHQGHADEKTCTSRGKEKDYEASDLARAQTIIAHGSSSYAPSSRNEEKRPCKK